MDGEWIEIPDPGPDLNGPYEPDVDLIRLGERWGLAAVSLLAEAAEDANDVLAGDSP